MYHAAFHETTARQSVEEIRELAFVFEDGTLFARR